MRRTIRAVLVAVTLLPLAQHAHAQALGPQRQFLAIEPYYERTQYDNPSGGSKTSVNGYGGRLWINLDPFHFIQSSSIALFTSFSPAQNNNTATVLHYGAEYDQFFVRRPLGGIIDPFLTIGGGRYRVKYDAAGVTYKNTNWSLLPGGGVRIPIPNRFELRGDVKDLILFNQPTGLTTTGRTNNLLLQAALGITF